MESLFFLPFFPQLWTLKKKKKEYFCHFSLPSSQPTTSKDVERSLCSIVEHWWNPEDVGSNPVVSFFFFEILTGEFSHFLVTKKNLSSNEFKIHQKVRWGASWYFRVLNPHIGLFHFFGNDQAPPILLFCKMRKNNFSKKSQIFVKDFLLKIYTKFRNHNKIACSPKSCTFLTSQHSVSQQRFIAQRRFFFWRYWKVWSFFLSYFWGVQAVVMLIFHAFFVFRFLKKGLKSSRWPQNWKFNHGKLAFKPWQWVDTIDIDVIYSVPFSSLKRFLISQLKITYLGHFWTLFSNFFVWKTKV